MSSNTLWNRLLATSPYSKSAPTIHNDKASSNVFAANSTSSVNTTYGLKNKRRLLSTTPSHHTNLKSMPPTCTEPKQKKRKASNKDASSCNNDLKDVNNTKVDGGANTGHVNHTTSTTLLIHSNPYTKNPKKIGSKVAPIKPLNEPIDSNKKSKVSDSNSTSNLCNDIHDAKPKPFETSLQLLTKKNKSTHWRRCVPTQLIEETRTTNKDTSDTFNVVSDTSQAAVTFSSCLDDQIATSDIQQQQETAGNQSSTTLSSLIDANNPYMLSSSTQFDKVASVLANIPRPSNDSNNTNNNSQTRENLKAQRTAAQVNHRNFVRLNLRNKSGACKGARNSTSRGRRFQNKRNVNENAKTNCNNGLTATESTAAATSAASNLSNPASNNKYEFKSFTNNKSWKSVTVSNCIDPIDEYLDGTFAAPEVKTSDSDVGKTESNPRRSGEPPKCSQHQLPCKLVKVKKSTNGNKGRQFYACSLSRSERCNHFEWAEDNVDKVMQALQKSTTSNFVTRQVAAYMETIETLTVPELRGLLRKQGLPTKGKKQELLLRLAFWTRDEISKPLDTDNSLPTRKNKPKSSNNSLSIIGSVEKPKCGEIELDDDWFSDESETDEDSVDSQIELKNNNEDSTSSVQSDNSKPKSNEMSPCGIDEFDTDVLNKNKSSLQRSLTDIFGLDNFRDGQEWAIHRCLTGQRSLLVAPTGFGKSLCYSLPAALSEGVCIVVSPLISLIQDQLRELPPRIIATTLSGALARSKQVSIIDDLVRGRFKIVFVSPERLVSPSFCRLFRPKWCTENQLYKRDFPQVSLLCIDEAHCISQWGHYFRPSYLRIGTMIDLIDPKSVLAITATAGPRVANDICHILKIQNNSVETDAKNEETGVKILGCSRRNISVHCVMLSSHEQRLDKLISLLQKDPTLSKGSNKEKVVNLATGSIIIYVWRQLDAEAIADNLLAAGIQGGVVVYHGGMDAKERSKAQDKFLRDKARICVATVAFGLGINKPNIRGVIHMYLPSSPESYLQEIGRAGRDGNDASAVALILEGEVMIKHSLAHSDLVSQCQIETILQQIFNSINQTISLLSENDRNARTRLIVAVPLMKLIAESGCKAETIETFFSLLEATSFNRLFRFDGCQNDHVVVTPRQAPLETYVNKDDVVNAILACSKRNETSSNKDNVDLYSWAEMSPSPASTTYTSYEFSVADCAAVLGPACEPRHVFAKLRHLEVSSIIELQIDNNLSGRAVLLNVSLEAWKQTQDKRVSYIKDCVQKLYQSNTTTISAASNKVVDIHQILHHLSKAPVPGEDFEHTDPELFHDLMESYFNNGKSDEHKMTNWNINELPFEKISNAVENQLGYQIRQVMLQLSESYKVCHGESHLFCSSPDADFVALCTTKFLHGIPPCALPPNLLRHHPLYGIMQTIRFDDLHQCVQKTLAND